MNKLFSKIGVALAGIAMAIGVGVAIGNNQDVRVANAAAKQYTLTIDKDCFTTVSYKDNNNEKTTNALASDSSTFEVNWTSYQVYQNDNSMQWQKSAGYIYNSTDLNKIISVTVNSTAGSFTTYYGNEAQPNSDTSVGTGNGYFKVVVGNATGKTSSVVVVFEIDDTPAPSNALNGISDVSATVTAKVGDENWTITNASATGTINETDGQDVTDYVDFSVTTDVPNTEGTPEVILRATKKNNVSGSATYYEKTITATVESNPIADLVKITNKNTMDVHGVFALSNDGASFAGTYSSTDKAFALKTSYEEFVFVRLVNTTNGYYLKRVTKNNNNEWVNLGENPFINNSSKTELSESSSGSSVWTLTQGTNCVYLSNSSNDGRYLGLGSNIVKAYATSNLSTNLPVYLYQAPEVKLSSLTISGQTTTFTAGQEFSLGEATVTAHYSDSSTKTVSSGLTYSINSNPVTTSTKLNHDDHNKKNAVVTYTDDTGRSASTEGYELTVSYKAVTSISLDITEHDLLKGGTVDLTATVTDDFADKTVSWSTSDSAIASISDTTGASITVTGGSKSGTATITATAVGGKTATCSISVTTDPILNLLDSNSVVIPDKSTINKYTGDSSITLVADSKNVDNPTYTWNSTDTSVATITNDGETATVAIVGAGSSDISITVGSLTKTVTVSVTSSAVTSLTLTSSVANGKIFDGTYNNSLTLTPSIETVGNATKVINWETSDASIASISAVQTTNAAITVTGEAEGNAVITATSAYTPTRIVEFTVTVQADGVTALGWKNRGTIDAFAGDTLGNSVNTENWQFTPTWASGKTGDTPSFGTGANDVHVSLYDSSAPTVENEALTTNYVLKASDNGKYIVAFYKGTATVSNQTISVTNWRSVKESASGSATYNFSTITGSATVSASDIQGKYVNTSTLAGATVAKENTYANSGTIRLGTGDNSGYVEFDFGSSVSITSLTLVAHGWSSTESACTVSITNGGTKTTTSNSSNDTFEVTLSEATSKIRFSVSKKNRISIVSITFNGSGLQEVGKGTNAVALQAFVDRYMHMDYDPNGTIGSENGDGSCVGYYGKNSDNGAKAAFNDLTEAQRTMFTTNSAWTAEWNRLSEWARINKDELNADKELVANSKSSIVMSKTIASNTSFTVIIILSALSLTAVGGYFLLRRRKEY